MGLSNVELYEALKPSVGEEAARLIAEVVPGAEQLSTKHDLFVTKSELEARLVQLEGKMDEGFVRLEGRIERSSKETMHWMLTFFVPLWLGTWGTILAIVLKR
jgi:hypothetical protein